MSRPSVLVVVASSIHSSSTSEVPLLSPTAGEAPFRRYRMGHRRLFLLFLIVFLASATLAGGHAQAATITPQQKQQGTGGVGSMMRSMVGSRPPSCAGRCWWCGGRRCEAVQVPVTPKDLQHMIDKEGGGGASRSWLRPSSYNDRSNYKPLSWRCMCGVVILNHP